MIALGFAATFLSVASSLFATYKTHAVLSELATAPPAPQDTFFVVAHYPRLPLLRVLGMWALLRVRYGMRGGTVDNHGS
jgi:hypothetical protein